MRGFYFFSLSAGRTSGPGYLFLFFRVNSFPGVGGEAVWLVSPLRGPAYLGCCELKPEAIYICIEKSPATHLSTSNFFMYSTPRRSLAHVNLLRLCFRIFRIPSPTSNFLPQSKYIKRIHFSNASENLYFYEISMLKANRRPSQLVKLGNLSIASYAAKGIHA